MGLDTKYRPRTFDAVLGQDATIEVMQETLKQGRIFETSYIFAGPSGTGKTTLARILARSMLCDNLQEDGNPCNACSSCRDILEQGRSPAFREMDAANHSGKESIQRILENMEYQTWGGNDRRIYLIDECHRLSKSAMDALLKPMEESLPGSNDKRLVCLFCTTEPDKIRRTIKSRCLSFQIEEPSYDALMDRLAEICEQEGHEYTEDGLALVVEYGDGHIRDMVSAIDRVGRMGPLTEDRVRTQLGLDVVFQYYRILIHLTTDMDQAMAETRDALTKTNPFSVYQGVGQAALAGYRIDQGITAGVTFSNETLASRLYEAHGDDLLMVARHILESEHYRDMTASALMCELFVLRKKLRGETLRDPDIERPQPEDSSGTSSDSTSSRADESKTESSPDTNDSKETTSGNRHEEWASSLSSITTRFVNRSRAEGNGRDSESRDITSADNGSSSSPRPLSEDKLNSLWEALDE